jgi:hypothetical protein
MSSAFGEKPASCRRLPYGLMSLSEMVNCHIQSLCRLFAQMLMETTMRNSILIDIPGCGPVEIHDEDKKKMKGWLRVARTVADEFEWKAVHDRIEIFDRKLDRGINNHDLVSEIRVLKETIDKGLEWQLIYRYPTEKNQILTNWKKDWAPVLKNFPTAEADIVAGVDLWALSHSTASVFHFMRVLEHGLRALAKDVGKSFDVQNWQNVIDEIEAEIREIGKKLPRGTEKNERLQFLSSAAKEFVYFKDGWRNYVSHGRGLYDGYQARSVMEHVKSFMTTLSSKLSEHAEEKPC